MVRVVATGTFDIIHPGHIRFLKEAKKLGDWGFVLTATFSILLRIPSVYRKIVSEDRIPIALGFVGLIAGMGVSVNIAMIGVLLDFAWLYISSLIVLAYAQRLFVG